MHLRLSFIWFKSTCKYLIRSACKKQCRRFFSVIWRCVQFLHSFPLYMMKATVHINLNSIFKTSPFFHWLLDSKRKPVIFETLTTLKICFNGSIKLWQNRFEFYFQVLKILKITNIISRSRNESLYKRINRATVIICSHFWNYFNWIYTK